MLSYPQLNMEWLMLGKGKMYKDAAPAPLPEPEQALPASDLLFTDFDLDDTQSTVPESNISVTPPATEAHAQTSSDMNTLKEVAQTIVKQRNVSRIIIMFDDGTYQEM